MEASVDTNLATSLLLAGVIGMLILAIAVILFFVVYQRRLFAQNERMRQQELMHQRNLVNAAIQTQEVERKRIASDLHDEIGSSLSALRLYLRQWKPVAGDEKQENIRAQALEIISQSITATRQITHNLLPPSLEQFGFVDTAGDLCQRVAESSGMTVNFRANANERFPLDTEVAMYRILQELLNNTLKHAEASTVDIDLRFQQNGLSFRYRDDGKGFVWPAANDEARKLFGLGWKSVESRVNYVQGKLDLQSAPGEGVKVEITIQELVSSP